VSEFVLQLSYVLRKENKKIVTAESCTGGLVAKLCTDIAGSSAWFERGFITYSNLAKHEMLSVPLSDIEEFGAVSEQVVKKMALGALAGSQANYSLALSGIAGPDGGSEQKPVGTVWLGFASDTAAAITEKMLFSGGRIQVRQQSAEYAISTLLAHIDAGF